MTSLKVWLFGKRSYEPTRLASGAYVLKVQARAGILNPFSWASPLPTYLGRNDAIASDELIGLSRGHVSASYVPTSEVLDDPANFQFDTMSEARQYLEERTARHKNRAIALRGI